MIPFARLRYNRLLRAGLEHSSRLASSRGIISRGSTSAHHTTDTCAVRAAFPQSGALVRSTIALETFRRPYSLSSGPLRAAPAQDNTNKRGNPGKFVLQMRNITRRLETGKILFKDVNLSFYDGAKIGVIGVNGSGKSSLLKIIAGITPNFDGERDPLKGIRIGYLEQEPTLDPTKTVTENIMDGLKEKTQLLERFEQISAEFANPDADMNKLLEEQAEVQAQIDAKNCWNLNHEIDIAMDALRCPPGDSDVTNLSGGEKRRVALCRLLLSQPDMLILDEPTNHLDAGSVSWMERFLQDYKGCVIAVTHDRYFLDNVAGWILEIDGGKCYPFEGNYNQWLVHKAQRLDMQEKQDKARAKVISRELEWIRQAPAARQAKQKARVKAFQELSEEEKFKQTSETGALLIPQGVRLGDQVIEVTDLARIVDDKILFEKLSFRITKNSVLGIIGPNGSGKTTLLKMLTGELAPDKGTISIGSTVHLGYISQSRDQLNPHNMVWAEICGDANEIPVGVNQMIPARYFVAQFGFRSNDQQKRIHQLSGGERNRVQLAKSLRAGANVILLDEPTNDLDVDTLRALEECLVSFAGAAIVVSHDRWFLDRICNAILAFEDDGTVTYFPGNYSEYEKDKMKRLGNVQPHRIKHKKISNQS